MEEKLIEKWNSLLAKDKTEYFPIFLKYSCSIREHLSEEFKNKIIQDLIDYNYLPSDIFDVNDKYNDMLFYISILNRNKYEDILKNKYGLSNRENR